MAVPPAFASDAAESPREAATDVRADREWRFRVYLDEREIGTHDFYLAERDGTRRLRTEANFEVRLLFLKLYEYAHFNDETWRGNCLVRVESRTDANGRPYRVLGEQAQDHFRVASNNGQSRLPSCIMSFAYWNPAILGQAALLNTQNGEFTPVEVSRPERTLVSVNGNLLTAHRYTLRADELELALWYSEDGDWLALETVAEGGRILRYERST